MPINRGLLKREARQELAGASPNAMLMTLVYALLTTGVSTVAGMFVENPFWNMLDLVNAGLEPRQALMLALSGAGSMALFLTILIFIYSLVVGFGYTNWTLKASRGVYGEYGDLISGFSMVGRVLLLYLTLGAYCFLWYLLIFTPAIALAVPAFLFVPPLLFPLMLGALALFVMSILRYSMAVLCLIDSPESGVMAAIRRSRNMMRGNTAVFFNLMFSFIGWYVLRFFITLLAEGAMAVLLKGPELMAAIMAMDVLALQELYAAVLNAPLAVAVVNLAVLPLSLWLTPYVAITHARYYDLLQTRELGSVFV